MFSWKSENSWSSFPCWDNCPKHAVYKSDSLVNTEATTGDVLKNFANFTGKRLCLRPATLLKKRRCFPVHFAKFLRTPFFTDHLRTTALVNPNRVTNTIIIISMKKKKEKKTRNKEWKKEKKEKKHRSRHRQILLWFY